MVMEETLGQLAVDDSDVEDVTNTYIAVTKRVETGLS